MPALIELRGAAVGYGRTALLTGIDLAIEQSDFLAIVGPNGGGKTTLLRTLLGVLPPVSGRVEQHRALRIGYVPQRDHVDAYWPLTAAEVAMHGRVALLGPLRRPGPDDRQRVTASLARVGISDLADRAFRTLSGGQRQRTLIARALSADPELLALDEPTNGMDPSAETAAIDLLRELHAAGGLAVLMVSHRLEAVASCAFHIAFVDKERSLFRRGPVAEMMSSEALSDLYGRPVVVKEEAGHRFVYPLSAPEVNGGKAPPK